MQVHARAEDDIAAIFLGLVADGSTHLAYQFGVPGGGQTSADGECRSIECLVGAWADGVDTYAGRTVGQYSGGDAQSGNLGRCSGSTGN